MSLVIDASVAIKWVVAEAGSDEASALIDSDALMAPDLLFVECANTLWAMARRGRLSEAEARAALANIEAAPIQVIASHRHVRAAQVIAFELNQTAYDSLYLAVALSERAVVVTADEAFARAAAAHPVYASSVRLLIP